MAIDIQQERLIPLGELAKLLPNRPDKSTLWRWHRRGIGGVRLEVLKSGKTVCSSMQALQRFLDRTDSQPTSPPKGTNPRRQAIAAAKAKLEKANI